MATVIAGVDGESFCLTVGLSDSMARQWFRSGIGSLFPRQAPLNAAAFWPALATGSILSIAPLSADASAAVKRHGQAQSYAQIA